MFRRITKIRLKAALAKFSHEQRRHGCHFRVSLPGFMTRHEVVRKFPPSATGVCFSELFMIIIPQPVWTQSSDLHQSDADMESSCAFFP